MPIIKWKIQCYLDVTAIGTSSAILDSTPISPKPARTIYYGRHLPACLGGGEEIEDLAAFGARLKQEREKRNITLDDVAASTKIGTRMLRALEDEHFDQLPGGIFNRGFVRAYARHLGLDENQAIADYLVASGESLPVNNLEVAQPATTPPIPASEDSSADVQMPWGIIAILLAIVALAFATWSFYSRQKSVANEVPQSPSASQVAQPANANSASRETATVRSPAVQEPTSSRQPAPSPATPPTPPQNDASTSSPSPGSFVVLVKAREESWIRITADGKEIMTDTMAATTEESVEAKNKVTIRAGNAGALDFYFNGKKLPPQGAYDEVKTLTFDASGLQPTPRPEPALQPQPPQP